jgi:hypothetical protein
MSTFCPVSARARVEILRSVSPLGVGVADGLGVGVMLGIGVALGDGVTDGEGVILGLGVTLGEGVTEGVGVGLPEAVGVGVAVGVTVIVGVGVCALLNGAMKSTAMPADHKMSRHPCTGQGSSTPRRRKEVRVKNRWSLAITQRRIGKTA